MFSSPPIHTILIYASMTRTSYYSPPKFYKAPPLAQYLSPAKPTSDIYYRPKLGQVYWWAATTGLGQQVGSLRPMIVGCCAKAICYGGQETTPLDPNASYAQIYDISKELCWGCMKESLEFLVRHNLVRAKKLELPLIWDKDLKKYARWSADQRSADCALQHSFPDGGFELGECIFWGDGSQWTPSDAVKMWADEERYYNYDTNTCAEGQMCGHYTQIVWSTTTKLGCARVVCQDGDLELPLVWDTDLEKYARWWADQRSADCALQHSFPDGGFELGECIFWGGGSQWTPSDAVKLWADEEKYYDYDSNTCVEGQMCGHYTQIVWSTTRKLGCGRVVCQDGDVFMTCNYYPPGNVIGERPY
ncbi:LOW QUALITY PROTEIN: hypothetical protein Cgig2_024149 [Carnegiea gigantea]|uniref:SCP domain-containing protein n=1 Tax=Carnegiea gigantea TaxID=171969 RepID=A0A9Q1KB04_9CARY|nr:LOW QUALITY PROTEIN: hypothetical protein Cgig2_024149 [Carnegiea gigantea]